MIYTLTFNPSLDYIMFFESITEGTINRTSRESIFVGGKGINISLVLNEIGIKSTVLGFTAGFTGKAIENILTQKGIATDFINVENGFSRINVKVKADTETELNARGPVIKKQDVDLLFSNLEKISKGDILVLAGSVPSSLPRDIYEKILEFLSQKQVDFVVDAEKELLLNTLKYSPFLIKPNTHELEEIFGIKISDISDIVFYAKKLCTMGARNVIVSMAKDGAVLIQNTGDTIKISVPHGKVINSVGAGDSMIAGFIAGLSQKLNYSDALKLATACGSATAFSEDLADHNTIMQTLSSVPDPETVEL